MYYSRVRFDGGAVTSGEAASFLEHGFAAKTLISHPHNAASYAGYRQLSKMRKLRGRLREVLVHKNRTTGVSSEKRSRNIHLMVDNLLHAISNLQYACSSVLSFKVLRIL